MICGFYEEGVGREYLISGEGGKGTNSVQSSGSHSTNSLQSAWRILMDPALDSGPILADKPKF